MSNVTEDKIKETCSKDILNDKWDTVFANTMVKTMYGFCFGVVTSALLFKRKKFPIWIGTGFGLGRSYTEADLLFSNDE